MFVPDVFVSTMMKHFCNYYAGFFYFLILFENSKFTIFLVVVSMLG